MSRIIFTLLLVIIVNQAHADTNHCTESWVECGNEKCVAPLWQCDGDDDCGNGKDEENCEKKNIPSDVCLNSQFRCVEDNDCIPSGWQCDGETDCTDESDELNCDINTRRCTGFLCKNNYCIPSKWRCDGHMDCRDGSDEELCLEDTNTRRCTGFLCKNNDCIPSKRRCDGQMDCLDGSDEELCLEGDRCTNRECSQNCRLTSKGQECYCNEGYKLDKDNQTCIDINECLTYGFCSQLCTNIIGSYRCSCLDGYELSNRTCKAKGSNPLLMFSTIQEIRGIELRNNRYFKIQDPVSQACSVATDPRESRIYWSDLSSNGSVIHSSNFDGTERQVVFQNGLIIEGMAVDYVARNLYITDSGLEQVLACKMDGSMCYVLHDNGINKPRAIAVDPLKGMLYWSDWGDTAAGIYRSGMDGSRRISLVSQNIKWPNGIAVDHTTNRLFWTDAEKKTIEYITLDGKVRKVLIQGEWFHPYSLAVFEDNLYWSDWNTFSLETCNKFTGHKMNVMTLEYGQHIMGIHVYHPVLARRTNNPCWGSQCSHMCLIAPLHGYRCVCPPGFTLAADGRNCLIDDSFPMLFVNDENRIYHVRPETVGNSAVTELPVTHLTKIGSLDYDWKSKTLFVTDMDGPVIYAIKMTTYTRRELLAKPNLVVPEDLAFDWMSSNLYWVDSGKGTVEVISTVTSQASLVVADLSKPSSIALVPDIGRMFVSTIGENPSIAMYDMDGKNRKLIHSTSGLIQSIAVHPSASLLYWTDPKTNSISSTDYLKNIGKESIVKNISENVTSLAVSQRFLYWTDSKHHALTTRKQNGKYSFTITLPGLSSAVLKKVTYVAPPVVPRSQGSASCAIKNGGCNHLCLSSPKGRTCICPSDTTLSDDEMTCNEIPQKCPGDYFRCLSGKCILSSWKCDRRDDCGDNSDETECPKNMHSNGEGWNNSSNAHVEVMNYTKSEGNDGGNDTEVDQDERANRGLKLLIMEKITEASKVLAQRVKELDKQRTVSTYYAVNKTKDIQDADATKSTN